MINKPKAVRQTKAETMGGTVEALAAGFRPGNFLNYMFKQLPEPVVEVDFGETGMVRRPGEKQPGVNIRWNLQDVNAYFGNFFGRDVWQPVKPRK